MANKISQTSSDRSPPLYVQYALGVIQEGLQSKQKKFPFVNSKGSIVNLSLETTSVVKNVLSEAQKVLRENNKADLLKFLKNKEYVVTRDNNKTYTIGDLAKPTREKIEFGYLAEAILQCAITARLVERTKTITPSIIANVVRKYLNTSANYAWLEMSQTRTVARKVEYEADNRDIRKKDYIMCFIALNSKAFTYLKNREDVMETDVYLAPFFKDAANYVNRGAPLQHAEYFYTNGLVDKLVIKSLGVIGQKSTKTDIQTIYYEGYDPNSFKSGKPVKFNLNISVKINNEEQFGQATGIYTEAMDRFASAVGVTLSPDVREKITNMIPTTNVGSQNRLSMSPDDIRAKKLHVEVYKLVYEDIQNQLNNKKGRIKSFFDGIEGFLSMKDPSLVVVNIGGGDIVYYTNRFNDLKQRLKNDTIRTNLIAQPSGNYVMDFYISSSSKKVLRLSSRPIGPTFRNYVLSGEALRMWLSEIGTK